MISYVFCHLTNDNYDTIDAFQEGSIQRVYSAFELLPEIEVKLDHRKSNSNPGSQTQPPEVKLSHRIGSHTHFLPAK